MESAVRDQLIREFTPKIHYWAYRLSFRLQPHMDRNDLISAGMIGLMDAMKKFDPSRQVLFKTYAEFRIRGAMLDEIRSMDWVPRTVKDKSNLLRKTVQELGKKLGRPPADEEVAEALSMDTEEYQRFLIQAHEVTMVPIDDMETSLDRDGPSFSAAMKGAAILGNQDPLEALLSEDTKKILAKAIEKLPGKERQVISLYYFNGLTMKEVGKVLDLTESRISQIHYHAIALLREKLRELS